VKISGTRQLSAPRATVWEVLNDPSRMAKTMPGVESFEVKDDAHWSAKVKIPLGLGGLRMSVSFEKTDERHLEYSRLHAKGNGVGAIMSMDTQFHLADEGDGTKMDWEADVRIAGPVGSMGQRVLQPIVNQQVSHVLAALEREVQAGGDAAPAGTEGAEEGMSPLQEEPYSEDPQRPTTASGDPKAD
jgi:carbon monoxide dehydrogenase subunit G